MKVGIVGGRLAPYFFEAYANEMYLLSRELGIPVLACNDIGLYPFRFSKSMSVSIVRLDYLLSLAVNRALDFRTINP